MLLQRATFNDAAQEAGNVYAHNGVEARGGSELCCLQVDKLQFQMGDSFKIMVYCDKG